MYARPALFRRTRGTGAATSRSRRAISGNHARASAGVTSRRSVGLVDSAREENRTLAVAEIYRILLKRGRYCGLHPFDATTTIIENLGSVTRWPPRGRGKKSGRGSGWTVLDPQEKFMGADQDSTSLSLCPEVLCTSEGADAPAVAALRAPLHPTQLLFGLRLSY